MTDPQKWPIAFVRGDDFQKKIPAFRARATKLLSGVDSRYDLARVAHNEKRLNGAEREMVFW